MGSEHFREEMIRFLKIQQALPDRSVHLRSQNWDAYVDARESYFMALAREQGMTYSPPKSAISGVEQHILDRQANRLSQ